MAVLSDAFWHSHFAADPSIVGHAIPLDDGAYEVVGIMPVGVTYPVGAVRPTDLWVLRCSRANGSEAGASPPIFR